MQKITLLFSSLCVFLLSGCLDVNEVSEQFYSVTYHGNGAESGSVPVDNHSYRTGDSVHAATNYNNLVKTGYYIEGWSLSPVGDTEYPVDSTFTMGHADMLLFAVWKPDYTVVITESIPVPSSLTLSYPTSLAIGESLTITVNEEFSSYTWYINGTAVELLDLLTASPANSKTLSLETFTLQSGIYEIMVVVTDSNGVKASESCRVHLTN